MGGCFWEWLRPNWAPTSTSILSGPRWQSAELRCNHSWLSLYPLGTIDYRTAMTVTLNLTHSTPQDLTILLVDPSSRGVYLTYLTTPSPSCNTSVTTSWADNQTAVMVKNGNVSLSSCPPSVVTPVEGVYSFGPVVGVDYGITTGSAVFATVYAGATTNGRWELMISSTGGSGTLYSWSLQLYSKYLPSLLCLNLCAYFNHISPLSQPPV